MKEMIVESEGDDAVAELKLEASKQVEEVEKGLFATNAQTPGYCYLLLFVHHARASAAIKLGRNPYFLAVASYAEANQTLLGSENLLLTVGLKPGVEGNIRFIQAHLQVQPGGLRPLDVVRFANAGIRLGMDSMSLTNIAGNITGGEAMDVRATGQGIRREIHYYKVLKKSGTAGLDFSSNHPTDDLFEFFESAKLISAKLSISVVGGSSAVLDFAITGSSDPPDNDGAWLSSPYSFQVVGNQDTATLMEFVLPDGHGFGKELIGTNIGNSNPKFWFRLSTANAAIVRIKLTITVDLFGVGLSNALEMTDHK